MVARIAAASPGPDLLDVGSGTGIEARQFQAIGCTVLGVEADPRMAEFARRTGVETEVAMIEDWDPAGRTFDAVVAGQSWHWVDPVAGAAKAALVLRPGGRLALFWHVFQFPPAAVQAFRQAYREVAPDSPVNSQPPQPAMDTYQVMFGRAADGIRQAGRFTEPEQWPYDWQRTYTRDELLDLIPTTGLLTALPPDRAAQLLAAIGASIGADSFTMDYTTVAVTAVRTDGD
jgi:SAM-dependent methyltransferase